MSAADRADLLALLRAGTPDAERIAAFLNADARAAAVADALAKKDALGRSLAEGR